MQESVEFGQPQADGRLILSLVADEGYRNFHEMFKVGFQDRETVVSVAFQM